MDYRQLADEALARSDELALCTETPGKLTRTFLSDAMAKAQQKIRGYMEDAGMEVRLDALGNIIGRLNGNSDKVFLTGSHIDTVPDAGKYDGMLGVLIGIAAAKALRNTARDFHLDVIGFSEEEGVRFRMPYLGSLAVAGLFQEEYLERLDPQGICLREAIRNFGLAPENIPQAAYDYRNVLGFAEVHIEQGPVLETHNLALGAVTGLVGQSRIKAYLRGLAGHAGTSPMPGRRDAFAGLAELAVFVEKLAQSTEGLVATIGMVQVRPGGANVIPGEVYFSLDIRHGEQAELDRATELILSEAGRIADKRHLQFTVETREAQAVVKCNDVLVNKMAAAMEFHGHQPFRLPSGAGHDTAVMARVTPTAMLFIRSPGGVSHNPIESVRAEDVAAAIEVFVKFLQSV